MDARWESFAEDSDRYNLQYRTAGDGKVRNSKYPATPHDEAMARGEEALQRDTKGIFRFNPGLEKKTVLDYNPYTIRTDKIKKKNRQWRHLMLSCKFSPHTVDSHCKSSAII